MPDKKEINKPLFFVLSAMAALIAAMAYLGALNNHFLNWDDSGYVSQNPRIRSLDLTFVKWAFTSFVESNWHPLTMISYAVDFRLWGLDPFGFHLTNVVFHGLNTFLVAVLSLELFEAARSKTGSSTPDGHSVIFASVTSALLFGLHPLRVESVAWVAERKDVLSGFFFFLSVIMYLRYCRRTVLRFEANPSNPAAENGCRRGLYYLLSLLFFILALLSKPMAVTLPAVLLVLDFYPLKRLKGFKKILEKIPFFIFGAASAVLTVLAQESAMAPFEKYPLFYRAANAVRAYAFYLYRTLFPVGLAPYYPPPVNPFDLIFFTSLFLMILLAVFSVLMAKKKKIFLAVLLYYMITLSPVIGIIQAGGQFAADRYTYIPLTGMSMLAAAAVGRYYKRARIKAVALALFVSLALMGLTIKDIPVWKDSLTLWSHEIKMYPGRVPHAYVNRGIAYAEDEKKYAEALADFNAAIRIAPGLMQAYNDRGVTYMRLKRYGEAAADFDRSLYFDPGNPDIYQNRGISFLELGEPGRAIGDLGKAVSINPESGVYYYHLGRAYAAAGDRGNAKESFKKALKLGVKDAEAELER